MLASIIAGINDGYAISNMPIEVVQQYGKLAHFDLDKDPNGTLILSLLESIMMVGSAIGCCVTSIYIRKLGLTRSILVLYCLNMLINIIEPIPVHWIYLVCMRGLSGFLASSISSITPLLMAIMLNPHKRAKAVMLYAITMNLGVFLAYLMNLIISFTQDLYWLMFLAMVILSVGGIVNMVYLLKF